MAASHAPALVLLAPTPEAREIQLAPSPVFRRVPEGYIGFVVELPGANTQGATLEEARSNLQEAVGLVLEANRTIGSQQ